MKKIHKIVLMLEDLYTIMYKNLSRDEFQRAEFFIKEIKNELRDVALVKLDVLKDNLTVTRYNNANLDTLIDNVATVNLSSTLITQKTVEEAMYPEAVEFIIKDELFKKLIEKLTNNEEY